MFYPLVTLNVVLMILLPILLAVQIQRWRRPGWGLFGIGAVTFIASQLFHIPFNALVERSGLLPNAQQGLGLVALALFYGFSAGLFEEIARYITFRRWATTARSWGQGLMLGAGHGGIEAIILGCLGVIQVLNIYLIRSGAIPTDQIPADQLSLINQQIDSLLALPWYNLILGAVERLFALTCHLALSLLVMQCFVRGQRRWLWLAVGWHAFLDAVAVFGLIRFGPLATEGLIALVALLSLAIIFGLRSPEPVESPLEPLPEVGPAGPLNLEITSDTLDNSRYN